MFFFLFAQFVVIYFGVNERRQSLRGHIVTKEEIEGCIQIPKTAEELQSESRIADIFYKNMLLQNKSVHNIIMPARLFPRESDKDGF